MPSTQDAEPGVRVLVVDDELNITDLLCLGLRYEGFEVKSAADGREGPRRRIGTPTLPAQRTGTASENAAGSDPIDNLAVRHPEF